MPAMAHNFETCPIAMYAERAMPAMAHDITKVHRHYFAGMAHSYGISATTLSSGIGNIAIYFYAKLAPSLKRLTLFDHQL